MLTLQTDRLKIRALCLEDAPFILKLLNQPGWLRFIGDKHVHTVRDAQNYLCDGPMMMYETLGLGLCLVQLKTTPEKIGLCGILKRDHRPYPELGYALLEQFQGQGYATEAAQCVVQNAFSALKMTRLDAISTPDNVRSRDLLRTLGFAFQDSIVSESSEDLALYTIWQPTSG